MQRECAGDKKKTVEIEETLWFALAAEKSAPETSLTLDECG